MSVGTSTNRVTYQGTSITTSFPFNFVVPSQDQLLVIYTDAAGVQTIITPQNYTVTGVGNPAGGAVSYPKAGAPIIVGTQLTIIRAVPYLQPTVLTAQGGFFPDVVEAALDNLEYQIQQLAGLLSSSNVLAGLPLTFPVVDVNPQTVLPVAAQRANKYLGFDIQGNPQVLAGTGLPVDLSGYVATASLGTTSLTLAIQLGFMRHIKQYGAKCDGITVDDAAIAAAIASFTAAGGVLLYDGTPLISVPVALNKQIRLMGLGGMGQTLSNLPSSYFIKKATMAVAAVLITANGAIMDCGGVVSQNGATGDSIVVNANGVSLEKVTVAGVPGSRDGIRIGSDAGGVDCNIWSTNNCRVFNMARHGINVHSVDGNASGGRSVGDFCALNSGDGFQHGNSFGNSIIGFGALTNTGAGLRAGSTASHVNIVGGYRPASNAGGRVVVDNGAFDVQCTGFDPAEVTDNTTAGVTTNSTVRNERLINCMGTWTPAVAGSSVAGAQTYSGRVGYWQRVGDIVNAQCSLTMSVKDGTTAGNIRITGLPFTYPGAFASGIVGCAIGGWGAVTLDAGYTQLLSALQAGNNFLELTEAGSTQALAFLPAANIGNATRIYFSIVYPINKI